MVRLFKCTKCNGSFTFKELFADIREGMGYGFSTALHGFVKNA